MSVRRTREPAAPANPREALRAAVLRFAAWDGLFALALAALLVWVYVGGGAAAGGRVAPEDALLVTFGGILAYFVVTIALFARIVAPALKGLADAR